MSDATDINAKAEQVLAQAAELPSVEEVRQLGDRAVARGSTRDMSLAEIRALADQAVACAEQVSSLVTRLSGILASRSPRGGEA